MRRVRHAVLRPAERVLDHFGLPALDATTAQFVEVAGVGEPARVLGADRVGTGGAKPPVGHGRVERRVRGPHVAAGYRRGLDRLQELLNHGRVCHGRLLTYRLLPSCPPRFAARLQASGDAIRGDNGRMPSTGVLPGSLPRQLTSFIGRERELRDLKELLERSRLLTLTGPGGSGKTRLGLQLAAEVASGFPAACTSWLWPRSGTRIWPVLDRAGRGSAASGTSARPASTSCSSAGRDQAYAKVRLGIGQPTFLI